MRQVTPNRLMEMLGLEDDGERLLDPAEDDPIWEVLKLLPARGYGPQEDDEEDPPFSRGYVGWGPYEDYMISKKGSTSWSSNLVRDTWAEFYEEMKDWDRDYNVIVDFYFSAEADGHQCTACEGKGLNPESKKLSDDWYSFDKEEWIWMSARRRYNNLAWQYHLEAPEIEALVKRGRLDESVNRETHVVGDPDKRTRRYYFDDESEKWMGWVDGEKFEVVPPEYPTTEEVNEWSTHGLGHDSINQHICVRERAKRLGVWGHCEHCGGEGEIRTGKTRLALYLWLLHPRKGASRGVHIKDVPYDDETMREVIGFLKGSRDRMAEIWKWVDNGAKL